MNFVVGGLIVFAFGIALMLSIGIFLQDSGYSQNQVLIAQFITCFIVISIPPILLIGGRDHNGDNKLEQLGKPVTFLASLIGHSLSSPTSIIIFLLIIIVNILVWK